MVVRVLIIVQYAYTHRLTILHQITLFSDLSVPTLILCRCIVRACVVPHTRSHTHAIQNLLLYHFHLFVALCNFFGKGGGAGRGFEVLHKTYKDDIT